WHPHGPDRPPFGPPGVQRLAHQRSQIADHLGSVQAGERTQAPQPHRTAQDRAGAEQAAFLRGYGFLAKAGWHLLTALSHPSRSWDLTFPQSRRMGEIPVFAGVATFFGEFRCALRRKLMSIRSTSRWRWFAAFWIGIVLSAASMNSTRA